MKDPSTTGSERPTADCAWSDEDGPDWCERCGKMFITVKYVNGRDICGVCYADKMGYLAEEHPRKDQLTDDSGGDCCV